VASFCEKFLRAYYNQDYYDIARNGEQKVVRTICDFMKDDSLVILDVGANKGEWTSEVLKYKPDATIYCFEILPSIANELSKRFDNFPNVSICAFGLSSEPGKIDVFWNKTSDDTSSITPRHRDPLFVNADVTKIECKVELGDAVAVRFGLKKIDLLKIDVEGHEVDVLQGFQQTFSSIQLAPKLIQFEYGVTYIPPRHTLQEIYKLLEPHGYMIGRLYPDGVKFKKYQFDDDNFRMGNYIASHLPPLIERLSRF
jgi:FkbM family methyltransferase